MIAVVPDQARITARLRRAGATPTAARALPASDSKRSSGRASRSSLPSRSTSLAPSRRRSARCRRRVCFIEMRRPACWTRWLERRRGRRRRHMLSPIGRTGMRMSASASTSADQMPAATSTLSARRRSPVASPSCQRTAAPRRGRHARAGANRRAVPGGGARERRPDEPRIGLPLARAHSPPQPRTRRGRGDRAGLRAADQPRSRGRAAAPARACAPAPRAPPASRRS